VGEFVAVEQVDVGVVATEEQQRRGGCDAVVSGALGAVLEEAANGAMPDPAATMAIGVSRDCGGWNAVCEGRTLTATFVPGRAPAR
jgi:hypothetical protein